jgi:hypothetical protein
MTINLQLPVASTIGFNYFYESMGYIARSPSDIQADIQNILSVCGNIKIYYNPLPYNANGISNTNAQAKCVAIAQAAKAAGLHVVWIETIDQAKILTDTTTDLTGGSSNRANYLLKWNDYVTQVVADAAVAQGCGCDEFVVGDSIIDGNHYYANDPGSGSSTQIYIPGVFPTYISNLVTAVRANFSGKVSYEEGASQIPYWSPGGVADLQGMDLIYWDLFDDWASFQVNVVNIATIFTTFACIGEVGGPNTLGALGYYTQYTELDWSRELLRRYDYLRQYTLPFYIFCFADTVSTGNGIRLFTSDNQSFHDIWQYLLRNKTQSYTEYFSDTFPPNDFIGGVSTTTGELQVSSSATTAIANTTSADIVFRGNIKFYTTGITRLLVRYTDNNNYFCLQIDANANQIKFLRKLSGVETQLGATIPYPVYSGNNQSLLTNILYTYEIRIQGSGTATQIEAFFDSIKILELTDSGNTLLNNATVGILFVSATASILTTFATSIETITGGNATPSLSSSMLTFTGVTGSGIASQSVILSNTGSVSGSYVSSISYSTGNGWLSISPGVGILASGTSVVQTFSIASSNLVAGTYIATVNFGMGGNTVNVVITLILSSPTATTPLSLFLTAASSTTITTSNKLYIISGTPTTTWSYSRVGTATGYGEICAQTTVSAWAAATTLPNPSGNGFFLDANTLGSAQIPVGIWKVALRLNGAQGGNTSPEAGVFVADIIVRASKYSAGTYTTIVVLKSLAQNIPADYTTFNLTGTAAAATNFLSTDKIYIDCFLNITTNINASSVQDIRINRLSTDTVGLTGDSSATIILPGYTIGTNTTSTSSAIVVSETAIGTENVLVAGSSGGNAVWTYDAVNARLIALGGTYGVYLYKTPANVNGDCSVILDYSDHGGIVFRYSDQYNFYDIAVHDASALIHSNTIAMFKTVNGVRTQISNYVSINFARNTPHVVKVIMQDSLFTVNFDEIIVMIVSDTSLSLAGSVGMRNNGGIAQFYSFRYQGYGSAAGNQVVYTRVRMTSSDPTVTPQLVTLATAVYSPSIEQGTFIAQTKYSVLNKAKMTLADVYDDLARQSNFWWKISNGTLYFHSYSTTAAPWVATENDIQVQSCEVDVINDSYRNTQWIIGGIDTITRTESFIGDGISTTFTLGYPIDTITSISLNYINQTFGIKSADTGKSWYFSQGQSDIVQDTSGIPLTNTQTLIITYEAQISVSVRVQNDTEISRLALIDGTTGIVEEAENYDGLNKQTMILQAYALLKKFATPSITIKFVTLRSGLDIGQLLTIFLPQFRIWNQSFLIIEVSTVWNSTMQNGIQVPQPFYTITATNGPIIGDYSRWFVNLTRG